MEQMGESNKIGKFLTKVAKQKSAEGAKV